jgi:hypothetical protein
MTAEIVREAPSRRNRRFDKFVRRRLDKLRVLVQFNPGGYYRAAFVRSSINAGDSRMKGLALSLGALVVSLGSIGAGHASGLFVPGSTFQVETNNSPDSYTDTVNLAAGTQSLDGGAVSLTISIVPTGGTNEWLVFSYSTTSGSPLSGYDDYWSVYQVGLDAAVPVNLTGAYDEFLVNGVSQTPSNGIFPGADVLSNPVPGMTGMGVGNVGYSDPLGGGPLGGLGAYMYPYGAYLSDTNINPATVNGYSQALEFQATTATTPEPTTWVMMLIGFAGLGFAGYAKGRKIAPTIA